MSSLDLIRSLRHAMEALREAADLRQVQQVAAELIGELERQLHDGEGPPPRQLQASVVGSLTGSRSQI